jgi:integrase
LGDGIHCWTFEEIEQFRNKYNIGSKARLAFELLYYTGQRRGDVVKLGPALTLKDKTGWLRFTQEKNGRTEKAMTVTIPVHPKLQEVIAATPKTGGLFWLVQDNAAPYTKESFGNMFRDWCDAAGLPQCSAHGLRKACVVRLIKEGATPHQVMSITGHKTLKEIDRYSRDFMREQAAEEVLDRWLAAHQAA